MKSQKAIIYEALSANPGMWIAMPELAKRCRQQGASESYAVHSRAADLRKEGHRVENRITYKGRKRISEYRLLSE